MSKEHSIVNLVKSAQSDVDVADELIRSYLPFIKAEVSTFLNRYVDSNDDEVSIGMMAFHEAILSYSKIRGSFLKYASLTIRSRLIDFSRTQVRHNSNISLDQKINEDEDLSLLDTISDEEDNVDTYVRIKATESEIEEFRLLLNDYGITLDDLTETSPKQERTLLMCHSVIQYANKNRSILDELLRTKKLPMNELVMNTDVNRKTIERHRKYILGMLLVLTNGFDIIRGHLEKVIVKKGEYYS